MYYRTIIYVHLSNLPVLSGTQKEEAGRSRRVNNFYADNLYFTYLMLKLAPD